jgi:hypothetical protein
LDSNVPCSKRGMADYQSIKRRPSSPSLNIERINEFHLKVFQVFFLLLQYQQ